MPLTEPTFDSRSYRQILAEALVRVPAHNPEWTNLSDSDPGVTLLQLFAFMTESLLYRANRIPERNRAKFLRLLGIPMRAAQPALGLVSFSKPKGEPEHVLVKADSEVLAGRVPFRTGNALEVLPIEGRIYYKSPLTLERQTAAKTLYDKLYASFQTAEQQPVFYETRTFATPESGVTLPAFDLTPRSRLGPAGDDEEAAGAPAATDAASIDGILWLALLARRGETPAAARRALANRVLTLGVLPALDASGRVLRAGSGSADDRTSSVTLAGGAEAGDAAQPSLIFELPVASSATGTSSSGTSSAAPARYRRLTPRGGSDLLDRPGVVELPLPAAGELGTWSDLGPQVEGTGDYPPSLEDSDDADQLITWIRVRLSDPSASAVGSPGLSARLSWLGINAATVEQRARVAAEQLPRGTGEPDQTATLVNTPVLVDSVRLTVAGEPWQRIDDLAAAGPEVPPRSPRMASEQLPSAGAAGGAEAAPAALSAVYTADRESGEIRFGDGARGMRPPLGASIQASYAYGGGRRGVVAIGAIKSGPALSDGIKVINPVPTWGGDEAETVAEAEKAIPAFLRHRDRLVSAEDFAEILWRTPGVDLGRLEVLPLYHPEISLAGEDAAGVVTVLVVPRDDPEQPDAPRPDRLFLETVCRHLEPRRLITTELHVRGPEYSDVWVSLGVDVVPGRDSASILEQVRQAIRTFLSPLEGGFEGGGWPLGKAVEAAEITAAASRVAGVAKVAATRLGDSAGEEVARVPVAGLQLPRLVAVTVEVGSAPTIQEIRTGSGAPADAEADAGAAAVAAVVPVPVVPEVC